MAEPATALPSTPRGTSSPRDPMPTSRTRTRWGALALLVAGVLFVLYPAVRPWQDEPTVVGAIKAMSSGAWVAAHRFAMVGFILVALGLLAVWTAVNWTRAERLGFAAVVTAWIGVGLTLPYAVLAAVTIWCSEVLPRASGILFALFLPQFSTPPAVRVAHGGLVAAGSMWLALALWRASQAQVGL